MNDYPFKQNFEVRDYECDLQGIVNNAVYLHYLEHTRHVFLKHIGIDFANLAEKDINLVVIRAEIDYLCSLRSGNQFVVCSNWERVTRLRFGFLQNIYRLPDHKPILKARTICTSVNNAGKPILSREFITPMEIHFQQQQA